MLLTTLCFLFAGCQSATDKKMTVINPTGEEVNKPAIQWVKKHNVYHLTLNKGSSP